MAKPPLSADLLTAHPLASGLVLAWLNFYPYSSAINQVGGYSGQGQSGFVLNRVRTIPSFSGALQQSFGSNAADDCVFSTAVGNAGYVGATIGGQSPDGMASTDAASISFGFTQTATVITPTTGAAGGNIFGRGRDTFGNGWSLTGVQNATTLSLGLSCVTTSGGAAGYGVISNFVPVVGQAYRITMTYAGGVGLAIWVNGSLDSSTPLTTGGLRTSTAGWGLGGMTAAASTTHERCVVSDFLVHNRLLTAAQIASLAANPYQMFGTPAGGSGGPSVNGSPLVRVRGVAA